MKHAFCLSLVMSISPNAFVSVHAAEAGQSPASTALEEVIVTATKRETKLQDTPISISAYGVDYLERNNVRSFAQIADSIPNLRAPDGLNGMSNVSIRGISSPSRQGAAVEQPVGTYLDQVYVGNSLLEGLIFDVQQIEVSRGPQGTLFGRNTAAGAISYTTRQPTWTLGGYASAEIGNYDLRGFQGALSGPIVDDTLAARIAVAHYERDGYVRRLSGGSFGAVDADAVRGSVLFQPTDALQITLTASYLDQQTTPPIALFTSGPVEFTLGNDGRTRVADINDDGANDVKLGTITALAEYSIGDYKLTSITGYRGQKSRSSFDEDMTVADLFANRTGIAGKPNQIRQVSQELRLTSPLGGKLDWTTGLYFYDNREEINQTDDYGTELTALLAQFGEVPATFHHFEQISWTDSRTRAYAWYGQANYHVTDALTAIVGLRANREIKKFGANADALRAFDQQENVIIDLPSGPLAWFKEFKDDVMTPMAGLQYRLSPEIMFYGTYSQGYKSGGFNPASASNANVRPFFGAETAKNLEVGLRSSWLEHRLTANATLFWIDYSDLQTQQFVDIDSQVVNAGQAVSRGFEFELAAAPTSNWNLNWGLGYTDATYRDFKILDVTTSTVVQDYSDNRLPFAPKWTSSLASEYDVNLPFGTLSLQAEWVYSSAYYQELTNDPFGRAQAYSLLHARAALTWPAETWQIALWGRNLTDEYVPVDYNGQLPAAIFGGARFQAYGAPRTYGLEVRVQF